MSEFRAKPNLCDIALEEAQADYDSKLSGTLSGIETHGDCVLGLSGGRDSRHILLGLLRLGQRIPRLVTSHHYLGGASSRDVEVAGLVAKRLGISVETVLPLENRIDAERTKNELTEHQSLSHSWALRLADAVSEASVLFDGMNGGALFGRSSLVRVARSRFGEVLPDWEDLKRLAIQHLFDRPVAALRGFVAPEILSSANVDVARCRLEGSLNKYADYANPLQAFTYYNHVARDTSLFAYGLMKARSVVCPLDSPGMVAWALTLPWKISSDSGFQASTIRRAFPGLADLPFEDEFRAVGTGFEVDRAAERGSIELLLARANQPVVTRQGAELLRAGKASLRQLQIFVYLTQLTEVVESGVGGDG